MTMTEPEKSNGTEPSTDTLTARHAQLLTFCRDGVRAHVEFETRSGHHGCVAAFVVGVSADHATLDVLGRCVVVRLDSLRVLRESRRRPDARVVRTTEIACLEANHDHPQSDADGDLVITTRQDHTLPDIPVRIIIAANLNPRTARRLLRKAHTALRTREPEVST
jgi:hypothetical protein